MSRVKADRAETYGSEPKRADDPARLRNGRGKLTYGSMYPRIHR